MSKTIAVIGLGTLGRTICEVLTEKGAEVIAIDNTPAQINKVKDIVTQAIQLDSADEDSIASAPFDQVDAAIVAIGDNIEASILTTTLLKQHGVPYIISRAVNKTHHKVLKQVGAKEVVNVEEEEGARIAMNLMAPTLLEKVKLSRDIYLQEMPLPPAFIKTKLASLNLIEKFNLRLGALRRYYTSLDRDGNSVRTEKLLFPEADEELQDGDVLILIGSESDLEDFRKAGEE